MPVRRDGLALVGLDHNDAIHDTQNLSNPRLNKDNNNLT